jgi:transcriptional regulator with XRE-family HTH domain
MSNFNHLKLSGAIAQSGMTQIEISEKLGVHYNTISAWANGRSPHPDKLYDLLFVLGWDAEQLKQERLVDWYAPNEATPAT